MKETWKNIKGYEKHYKVSTMGRVYSVVKNKLLSLGITNKYLSVGLYSDAKGRSVTTYVHRLVAEAFIPNPDNKPHVNHKDLDKTNAIVSNLEWATEKENHTHATKNGHFYIPTGENSGHAIFTEDLVIKFRSERMAGASYKNIGTKYGFRPNAIRFACVGDTWKHVNFPKCPSRQYVKN